MNQSSRPVLSPNLNSPSSNIPSSPTPDPSLNQLPVPRARKPIAPSNIAIFAMMMSNVGVTFICCVAQMIAGISQSQAVSGWFIILVPVLAALYCILPFINSIIGAVNLKVQSRKLQVVMLILNIISIWVIFGQFRYGCTIWFWVCLVANLAPSVFLFINLLTK